MKLIIPVKVDHDTEAYDLVGGHVVRAVKWTLRPEQLDQIRQGYGCLNCMEPFEESRTRGNCPLCGYNLADTLHDLRRVDRGGERVGPATSLEDERERLILESEIRRHQKGSSIIVPGKR